MSDPGQLKRRRFLQAAAAAAACGPLVSCTGKPGGGWRFFTEDEARTVDAICERLIPADTDDEGKEVPGASWAGVVKFIDRQLAGFYADHQATYRQALEAVNEASEELLSRRFTDLDSEGQVRVLQMMEKGTAPGNGWSTVSSREFFRLILRHTQQGFYGDPRHGGNRDGIGWHMLGIPYPPVRGRDRYEDVR